MLYEIPYPNFIPPLTKQKKNENWQSPTYPILTIIFTILPTSLIDCLRVDTI